jgi:hypothetical protein
MRRCIASVLACVAGATGLAACGSNADQVSQNISTEAEQFNVQRRIVGVNGITDKVEFVVEGRCSVERGVSMADTLDVICRYGPRDYRKNYIGLSDNTFFIVTQLKGIKVSEYHTKVVLKPTSIVPNLDLLVG